MEVAVGSSSVGVFTLDRELIVRSWDTWLVEATGLSSAQVCGTSLLELFPDVASRGLADRLRRVAEQGSVELLSSAFHRYLLPCAPRTPSAHFDRMQQHVTLSPLRTGGELAGVIVSIEDVTERLDRERMLAAQLKSDDEAIRLRAARALADDAAASTLTNALGDASWRVRQVAAEGVARNPGETGLASLLDVLRQQHRDLGALNAALSALTLLNGDPVPPIIDVLASDDVDARTYAALALGQLADVRAVQPLLRLLEDSDANVRFHAIEALGRIGSPEAAAPLAAVAEARDFFLSFAALEALSAIGDATVAGRIAHLLDDPTLRVAAAHALGSSGGEDVVGPLARVLNESNETTDIAVAFATLHDRFEENYSEGTLIADLARATINEVGARKLVAALGSASDADLPALVRVLGWLHFDGVERALVHMLAHSRVRRIAAAALVRRGDAVVPTLSQAAPATEPDVQKEIASILGRIGSPRAVPALIGLLGEGAEQAISAASALGNIGDRRAFEPLLSLLDHDEAAVRQAAVSALSSIGHADMPARVAELLNSPSARVREAALRITGYFGYAECLDRVLELCVDEDPALRRAAVEQLPFFDDARANACMSAAFSDPVASVRAAAARALAHMQPESALPLIDRVERDHDPWVLYYTLRSVAHLRLHEAIPTVLRFVDADRPPHVRIAAVGALGELRSAEAAALLAQLALEDDAELADAALEALGRIPGSDAMHALRSALQSAAPQVRMRAIDAMAEQHAHDNIALIFERAAADESVDVANAAIRVLGRIGNEQAVSALLTLAKHPRRAPAAISALSKLGPTQAAWIAQGLESHEESHCCAVVEALSRMRNVGAARLLSPALNDPSAAVRIAAAQALGRLDVRDVEHGVRVSADSSPDLRAG